MERDDENPVHLKGSKCFSTRLPCPSDKCGGARKRKGRLRQEFKQPICFEVTLWHSFPLSNFLGAVGMASIFQMVVLAWFLGERKLNGGIKFSKSIILTYKLCGRYG